MKHIIQQMSFSEFSTISYAVELFNHGRRFEVFVGVDSLGFSDATSVDAAKKEVHKREVNNALYGNELDAPDFLKSTLPSAAVLDEYPDLKEIFPYAAGLVTGTSFNIHGQHHA